MAQKRKTKQRSQEAGTTQHNGKKTKKQERIPVTILSGFLGSGKTTLLQHILTSKEHRLKVAVIVNDMAELNIDGQTIARTAHSDIVKTKKEIITLENGCICCTLRGDLIREIQRIRETNQFDYVLIESTGIAEPQQVAESFCVDPETEQLAGSDETMLWNTSRLDTCVTVVDVVSFPNYLASLQRFKEVFTDGLDDAEEGEGEKSISELLVEQVEFANVILLNKIDLASKDDIQKTEQLIKILNPKAHVVSGSYGKIDLKEILNTHRFNLQDASKSPGWLTSLKNGVTASQGEADEYGVTSFVYRERKPFHPRRLHSFLSQFFCFAEDWNAGKIQEEPASHKKLQDTYGSILRSKGSCWIAGRDDHEMEWAQAGRIIQIKPAMAWYCLTDPKNWEGIETDEDRDRIEKLFYPTEGNNAESRYEFGDRRQQIVFIGTNLQREAIMDGLQKCLLSDEELKEHQTSLPYGAYPDPLHPNLIQLEGSSNLFMIARPGQNQHLEVMPGSKLTLQSLALNISENEDLFASKIRAVKVWLDRSDASSSHGILLATLRPHTHEFQSTSVDLLPMEEPVQEHYPKVNRRIRVEAVLSNVQDITSANTDWLDHCEVHIMGAVEPVPYAAEESDVDVDDDEEGEAEDDVDDDGGNKHYQRRHQ